MNKYSQQKTVLTGLIYHREKENFLDSLSLPDQPLVYENWKDFQPSVKDFSDILKLFA